MDPYDYNQYAQEYNYNNPYAQQGYQQGYPQQQQQQQPQYQQQQQAYGNPYQQQQQQQQAPVQPASPSPAELFRQIPALANPKDENARLKEHLDLLKKNEERAKAKVAEYIYVNELEKASVANKIKFLKNQISVLRNELGASSMAATGSGELTLEDDMIEIKAGSQEKLIEALYMETGAKKTSTEYANVFLLTYRVFATPRELLDKLMAGYARHSKVGTANDPNAVCRLKIGNFLKRWIADAFHDWDEDMQQRFEPFTQNAVKKADPRLADALLKALQEKQRGDTKRTSVIIFSEPPPATIIPKVTQITSILDVSPLEIARQLTLIDYELCKRIEPKEFLGMAWAKKDKEKRSPNLLHFIGRFNMVSKWVALNICGEPQLKKRAKIVSHIVDIVKCLKDLNNFNGVFQIIGGLGNASVYRLTKTFEAIKDRKKDVEALRFLTKPEKSWANYRKELHGVNPPCIPFLGVYQTDLTFVEDGNPDKFANGLWNFKKCRMCASVITELQQYQQKPYNLQPYQLVFNWLTASQEAAKGTDDKKLYELSLQAEPREQTEQK